MLIHGLLAVVEIEKVKFQQDGFSAGFLDLLLRGKRILFLFGQIDEADIGSFSCVKDGYCAANARVSAGDENGFVFEKASAFIFLEVWFLAFIIPELREEGRKGRFS